MKRLFSSRKRIVAGAAAAGLALGGGAVIAYFTTGGSGSGSGATGSATAATVNQAAPVAGDYSSTDGALFPGSTQTVHLTVTNNGTGQQYIDKVSLSSVTSDKAGCDSTSQPTWFSMPDVTIGQNLAGGATSSPAKDGVITFNDSGSPQDACQGAALTFHYTSS